MSKITPPSRSSLKFNLKIIPLNLFGYLNESGWKYADEINGIQRCDGITDFEKALNQAVMESQGDVLNFMFPSFLGEYNHIITGEERLKTAKIKFKKLADPDLGYSLYAEEGQKTLNWIYDIFGIDKMEFLRRIITRPGGDRYSFILRRRESPWGGPRWDHSVFHLDMNRSATLPVLSFGSMCD